MVRVCWEPDYVLTGDHDFYPFIVNREPVLTGLTSGLSILSDKRKPCVNRASSGRLHLVYVLGGEVTHIN